jgi:hypothetical protein
VAIQAVRQATTTTPIIAGSDDLVGEGRVASLNRPGGNATGIAPGTIGLNLRQFSVQSEHAPLAATKRHEAAGGTKNK